jgi:hypothetical protein
MRLIVALRLVSKQHAKYGIESISKSGKQKGVLIDSDVTRLSPALKNVAQRLASTGRLPDTRPGKVFQEERRQRIYKRTADFHVRWCEVETTLGKEYWKALREVEAVIPKDDLENFMSSIRHYRGATYLEACDKYADELDVKLDPLVEYVHSEVASQRTA